MKIHFDDLYSDEFYQYGGQIIDMTGDPYYIFEKDFEKIKKENPDYFKDPSNYKCKLGKDEFIYNWKDETFYNKTYVDIKKYDVPKNDPLNIPNVCFSLVEDCDNDERKKEWQKQRIERGFDNTELWNLNYTMMKFMYPRIKAFREAFAGYPGCLNSEKEWEDILDKILDAFDIFLNKEDDTQTCTCSDLKGLEWMKRCNSYTEKDYDDAVDRWKRFHEGWELFHKWFFWLAD